MRPATAKCSCLFYSLRTLVESFQIKDSPFSLVLLESSSPPLKLLLSEDIFGSYSVVPHCSLTTSKSQTALHLDSFFQVNPIALLLLLLLKGCNSSSSSSSSQILRLFFLFSFNYTVRPTLLSRTLLKNYRFQLERKSH